MSLKLRQAIPGRPKRTSAAGLAAVATPRDAYFVYPSSSNVVLLHTDGRLHATLAFWDALPHRTGPSAPRGRDVTGVIVRDEMIIAYSGPHVVFWKLAPDSRREQWDVHSTIVAGAAISSIDYRNSVLALGTASGIEVWWCEPDPDIVVWDRCWESRAKASPIVAVPPTGSHVAWYNEGIRSVSIQPLQAKGQKSGEPQEIRQQRDIAWLGWRGSDSDDPHLYVISANAVLRIYATVLDDPTWFQLLYSLDHRAFIFGRNELKGKSSVRTFGSIWVPDAAELKKAASATLESATDAKRLSPKVRGLLEAIVADDTDVAVWFDGDGTVALRTLLNLDRKPPTLIQSDPLVSMTVNVDANWSSRGCIAQHGDSLFLGFPPSAESPDISSLQLSLVDLFLGDDESALKLATPTPDFETKSVLMTQDIRNFYRTPNGRGLLAVGEQGEVGVWEKRRLGKLSPGIAPPALVGKGLWTAPEVPIIYSIYAKGRGIASYYKSPELGARVVLQHLDPGDGRPTEEVLMPHFSPKDDDDIVMLLAVSDIDDGYSARRRRTRRAVIMAVAQSGEAWVWRVDPAPSSPRTEYAPLTPESPMARRGTIMRDSPPSSPMNSTMGDWSIYRSDKPIISLISHSKLPVEDGQRPRAILPVDPMGWHQTTVDWETDTPLQDMVLTVSESGTLEFWTPRLGMHLPGGRRKTIQRDVACLEAGASSVAWTRSGVVRTDKKNVVRARCSSRKKTVLICELEDGSHEMSIWDSNVSEFSTGLELTFKFEHGEQVQDLDWTTTSDLQSVLAVGFQHHVFLVCEQRMSYVDVTPGWATFINIDLRKYTEVPISDSIWIAGGSLAVATGNQIYVFSRFVEEARASPTPSPRASVRGLITSEDDEPEDIFELIAHMNGPLFDFHPTMLMQCLLWDKIDLVKRILVTLVKNINECDIEDKHRLEYQRLDPLDFHTPKRREEKKKHGMPDYSSLFAMDASIGVDDDDDEFNDELVDMLVGHLDGKVKIPLTQMEKSQLAAVAQATLEVEQSRRSLDVCGLRYLISIRIFANRERRIAGPLSGAATPRMPLDVPGLSKTPLPHAKISFRNIVWATHSESHEVLLQAATATCEDGKMYWPDARRLGVFLWMKSQESIQSQLEVVARNKFMQDRDPVSSSLMFFALGKKQVVYGLWRQTAGHKEQAMMLKFLSNDFTTDRWRTAAAKNAYALLSKQRYEYAAAFFMLAGRPKDAITVCVRQLDDWQLAVALARAVEGDGPLLKWVLSDTVLPIAFRGGHRWLASWTLWMLKRRDLSVRVLISPMEEIANAWSPDKQLPVGNPDNDDPSLLLLFQHLKGRTLQTALGTSEIPQKLEFDFVLHNSRIFGRMGCHPLGLDLLRSWSFDRPYYPVQRKRVPSLDISAANANAQTTRSRLLPPTPRRRESFMLSNPHGRESMIVDMDVPSDKDSTPSTRTPSPGIDPTHVSASDSSHARPGVTQSNDLFAGIPGWEGAPVKAKSHRLSIVSEEPDDGAVNKARRQSVANGDDHKKGANLMKEIKNDQAQGSMEFNMDSFFGGSTTSKPSTKIPTIREERESIAPNVGPEVESPSSGTSRSDTPSSASANLMKAMNSDTSQGAVEFNFDSFGFGGGSGSLAPPARAPTRTPSPFSREVRHSPLSAEAGGEGDANEEADGPNGVHAQSRNTTATKSVQFADGPDTIAPNGDKDAETADGSESPSKTEQKATKPESKDEAKNEPAKPKGLSLMSEHNKNSSQGAMEFNMDAFGF